MGTVVKGLWWKEVVVVMCKQQPYQTTINDLSI